ncbi:MAG: FecR domain-containing protein [Phycisphaerales bacterium]
MKVSPKEIVELFALLNKTLDGSLSQEQKRHLEHLLENNSSLHPYYVNFFILNSELRSCLSMPTLDFSDQSIVKDISFLEQASHETLAKMCATENIYFDQERIRKIRQRAERQLQDFLAEQECQRAEQQRQRIKYRQRFVPDFTVVTKKIDSLVTFTGKSIVTLAACFAIALVFVSYIQYFLAHRVIATLGENVNAKWTEPPERTSLGTGALSLEEGYAQLVFAKGARVIVQAPCNFTLISPSKMSVEKGAVIVKVPRQAIGFTIDTQTSSVKDFGTEFGVTVDSQARTEIHVFDGLIQLRSIGQARSSQNQWELTSGSAAIVDKNGNLEIGKVQDRPHLFVRRLPNADQVGMPGQRLNLADIVGGGNGLGTGMIGQGLHPLTGVKAGGKTAVYGQASGYVPTPFHEFIDGVFIPDSENGEPIVISSTGLQFNNCPDTSGVCMHIIRNGTRFQHEYLPPRLSRIRGQTFGIPEHPAIGMHANAGVTFDLDRIRAAHGDIRIVRFKSLCGISETVAEFSDGYWKSQRITAGFRVLVDGELRFYQELEAVPAQSADIDIALEESDRFLTLITTECHPDRPFAWCLFAEPILELSSKQQNKINTK